jgi:transcriptional regulator with XRE-family HTH domain
MARSIQQNLPPMPLEKVRDEVRSGTKSLRDWQATLDRARARAHLTQKVMASEMGITPQQLSDQLAGREGAHLSLWRLFALPKSFWHEFVIVVIDFFDLQIGMTETDRRDAELGRTVRQALERRLAG